ncbi:MAG: DUF5688 family protein [Lachnospiraceae bacterium]|nr:DUF5688 family protein [Lachnospiraceae bacterium]
MITDLDQVRDHIICKLVNAEMNAEYLANKPHTRIEDLAVMYAVDLGGSKEGHMTAVVTDNLLEMYGISKEEHPSMYVLSNSITLNGAAALLDAKTMEDISQKLGGDFIVLPSSIHEVIVLPADVEMDRRDLEAMVQDVNAGEVAPEDRLSDHVYMYDSKEKELVLADRMEERKQQREQEQNHEKGEECAGRSDKAGRTDRKPERERVSMKELLSEKKAEVAKNEAGREHPVAKKTRETAR